MSEKTLTLRSIAYHRNGSGGNGFYVVLFNDSQLGPMVGIQFAEPGSTAILHRDRLAQDDIAFGSNSWRGDHYEPWIREQVIAYEATR